MAGWRLEHSYTTLPQLFYSDAPPTPVREPRLIMFNRALAEQLGLEADALDTNHGAQIFAGNALPPGARPIAQAYAGHQFGHFTPLGDGRAIVLGEQITPTGARFDIQLKGAGPTRYSRRGDGRAALAPMLREYVISQAMFALGIPTTRSLAVATTGEPVFRESALEGAVLTRVAASHIRVGTLQWAAAHDDIDALRAIADYTRARHYPDVEEGPEGYLELLAAIVERQASLIAQWQLIGFVHGVMNTDNMALSGETIDFGPCAFMDAYSRATVFSSIDRGGRYAYGNQPVIAQWNLARLGEAMLPLFGEDADRAVVRATDVLERFTQRFEHHWLHGMRGKLGLYTEESDDKALADGLLMWMERATADFTNTFRALSRNEPVLGLEEWRAGWDARLDRQPQPRHEVEALMRRHNPAFIPRNHLVERALRGATDDHDVSAMTQWLLVLARPYDYSRDLPEFASPGPRDDRYRTFCGT